MTHGDADLVTFLVDVLQVLGVCSTLSHHLHLRYEILTVFLKVLLFKLKVVGTGALAVIDLQSLLQIGLAGVVFVCTAVVFSLASSHLVRACLFYLLVFHA